VYSKDESRNFVTLSIFQLLRRYFDTFFVHELNVVSSSSRRRSKSTQRRARVFAVCNTQASIAKPESRGSALQVCLVIVDCNIAYYMNKFQVSSPPPTTTDTGVVVTLSSKEHAMLFFYMPTTGMPHNSDNFLFLVAFQSDSLRPSGDVEDQP
jgi:hypothetical protein